MDIGVRELKQHLSDYLDRVAAGEIIRVTDRGLPKVLITPLVSNGHLERGIEEGWIREPQTGAMGLLGSVERFRSSSRVLDVLADDRGE
jgi:prevent-host-death family protein